MGSKLFVPKTDGEIISGVLKSSSDQIMNFDISDLMYLKFLFDKFDEKYKLIKDAIGDVIKISVHTPNELVSIGMIRAISFKEFSYSKFDGYLILERWEGTNYCSYFKINGSKLD